MINVDMKLKYELKLYLEGGGEIWMKQEWFDTK